MRSVWCVMAVLLLSGWVCAQDDAPTTETLTCPLDGNKFAWPAERAPSKMLGSDSDLVLHPLEMPRRHHEMVTCPRCNYSDLRTRFGGAPFDDATRGKLLTALSKSRYRGVEDAVREIPIAERCRLGSLCAKARGLPASERADFAYLAVWSIRTKSTRPATLIHRFGDPLRTGRAFALVERKMTDETDPDKRSELKLHLAMLAQRSGLPKERDRWLSEASKDRGLTAIRRKQLENFREAVVLETSFQRELVDVLGEAFAEKGLGEDSRIRFAYLRADTLRRLGRLSEAAQAFKDLSEKMTGDSTRRHLCDYYAHLLSEHLPKSSKP